LRVGSQIMERSTDVPRELVLIIQALIILFVMVDQLKPFLNRMKAKFGKKASDSSKLNNSNGVA
ncbi:hypothetical protein AB4501_27605, partial [Vibrio sp. 10N.222.55.E8]